MVPSRSEARQADAAARTQMTPGGFADQFRESFRVLWLIAVGVVREPTLAEDVVQEAAIIGLRKLDQFEAGSNFNAWMGQIVRNVALNSARKQRKRREMPLEVSQDQQAREASVEPKPAAVRVGAGGSLPPEQPYFDDRVMQALNSVSDVARSCLLLRTLEGLDYGEISRLLEIPEGTAMSHVHRTRKYLRERLADLGAHAPADMDDSP